MLVQFLPILLLLLLAAAFAAGSFLASKILGPLKPTAAKQGPYESGIAPRRDPAARFPVRFYLVAMIFIIFDIEVVFLYPWAVMYHQLTTFGLAEMGTFVGIVFVTFAYLVSNGALDWGPAQLMRNRPPADLARSMTATVKRVPRPDRVAIEGPGLIPVGDGSVDGAHRNGGREPVSVPAGAHPAGLPDED